MSFFGAITIFCFSLVFIGFFVGILTRSRVIKSERFYILPSYSYRDRKLFFNFFNVVTVWNIGFKKNDDV